MIKVTKADFARTAFALTFGVLVFVALSALTGCSSVSTQPDQVALHYEGGSMSSQKFKNCVPASQRQYNGPGDHHYIYPAGDRTFKATGGSGSDSEKLSIVSKDNVTFTVPVTLGFKLNTECKMLQKFHERIGRKEWATGTDSPHAYFKDDGAMSQGYVAMLNTYVKVPLDRAMDDAARAVKTIEGVPDWKSLWNNLETKKQWEDETLRLFPIYLAQQTGNEAFFTDFKLIIQRPEPPGALVEASEREQRAVQENMAQTKENVKALTKYDQLAGCKKKGLTEQTCVMLYGIDSGKITFLPQDTVINVPK